MKLRSRGHRDHRLGTDRHDFDGRLRIGMAVHLAVESQEAIADRFDVLAACDLHAQFEILADEAHVRLMPQRTDAAI